MYADYLRAGGFSKVRQISNPAFLTGLFPVAFLALLGLGSSAVFFGTQHWVGASTGSPLAGSAAGLALCSLLAVPALKRANRLGILWLLRTFAFIHRWSSGQLPELDQRINAMAEHILQCHRADPAQETLLVAHSVGCLLSVCVAARLLEISAPPFPAASLANIHLLTLGQCIPLISLLPQAASFRTNLLALSTQSRLPWTDVSAKADPLCFFRSPPLQGSDILQPTLKTARFFRMFPPETYQNMRWDKVRPHFQYLMASEQPTAYDYFAITAGPNPLEAFIHSEEEPPPLLRPLRS